MAQSWHKIKQKNTKFAPTLLQSLVNMTDNAGAKILLNNAVLNLKRGKRYGLCGPNGCGKSTLMRSIANGQVKEFPPQDELKTVYVEHDIDAEETQQNVLNFVSSDSQLKGELDLVFHCKSSLKNGHSPMIVLALTPPFAVLTWSTNKSCTSVVLSSELKYPTKAVLLRDKTCLKPLHCTVNLHRETALLLLIPETPRKSFSGFLCTPGFRQEVSYAPFKWSSACTFFVLKWSWSADRDIKEIEETLESVGFTLEMREKPIASLSGGWKMKLALARAMLWNADILLLDEPTNHLDVTNVAWLENYLTHLPTVTSIIVSHDSGFLDNVCTGKFSKLSHYVALIT